MDNCTLCTCNSERQPECYSNCHDKGYAIIKLTASSLRRNHTITITDSLATIIACKLIEVIEFSLLRIYFRFEIRFDHPFDQSSFASISICLTYDNKKNEIKRRSSVRCYS